MSALYALPDHEVVEGLLGADTFSELSVVEAKGRIRAVPGLVPIAVKPTGGVGQGLVYFADIGTHPFREWQFMYSIQHLSEAEEVGERFVVDMEILADEDLCGNTLDPAGFIFHVSRCGSTLMAKALARPDNHIVITQGGPLQRGFWAAICDNWNAALVPEPRFLEMFRNLVRLMARRRRGVEDVLFVKFISWNILCQDFVRKAYPSVPSLFLYRDPVEVIASVLKETTAVLHAKGTRQAEFLTGVPQEKTFKISDIAYLAYCYARYYETALSISSGGGFSVLNYTKLKDAGNFADILRRGLGFEPTRTILEEMLKQFEYHSKDDTDRVSFEADEATKQAALDDDERSLVDGICGGLTERLDMSALNLYPKAVQVSDDGRLGR